MCGVSQERGDTQDLPQRQLEKGAFTLPGLGVAASFQHLSRALCVIQIEILFQVASPRGEERVGDTVLGSELDMKNEERATSLGKA